MFFWCLNGWISNHVVGNPTTALSCPRCSGEAAFPALPGSSGEQLSMVRWELIGDGNNVKMGSMVSREQLSSDPGE